MLCRRPLSVDHCCRFCNQDAWVQASCRGVYKDRRQDRRDLGLDCWDQAADDCTSFFLIQEFVETWWHQAREGGTQRTNISFPSLFNRDGFEYIRTPVFGVGSSLRSVPILEDRYLSGPKDSENALGTAGWKDKTNSIKEWRRIDGNGGKETPNDTRRDLRGTL